MPAAYLKMKEKFKGEGLSDKDAKTKAAKIYNSTHDKPVGPNYEEKVRRKKKGKKKKGKSTDDQADALEY